MDQQCDQHEQQSERPNTFVLLIFCVFMIMFAHFLAIQMSKAVCWVFRRRHTSKCNWIGWTVWFGATSASAIVELATLPEWMIDNTMWGNAQIFGILTIVGIVMSISALKEAPKAGSDEEAVDPDEEAITRDRSN